MAGRGVEHPRRLAAPESESERLVVGALESRLIGRQDDLVAIAELVRREAVVTLAGPGGIGKTQLALALAAKDRAHFAGGVTFCDLTPVLDGSDVVAAVAHALGVQRQPGLDGMSSVVDHVRRRGEVLLVLDNCEQVVDAAAELVHHVTEAVSSLHVLATSRERLLCPLERVYTVRPLDRQAAASLFARRAGLAAVDQAVFDVCDRLDGLPLAIELAAAQAANLALADLAAALDDGLGVLRVPTRGRPARHGTLHDAVSWSYRLLDRSEQAQFDLLSVFAGGFDRQAVAAVGQIDLTEATHLLGRLADRSMVVPETAGPVTRYRLLETLRQYGQARSVEHGTGEAAAARHAEWFVAAAIRHDADFRGDDDQSASAWFDANWSNLRAAFHWFDRLARFDDAERLVAAASWYSLFAVRAEIGDWAQRLLERSPSPRARTWGIAAVFATYRAQVGEAADLAERGLAAQNADEPDLFCLFALALVQIYAGVDAVTAVAAGDRLEGAAIDRGDFEACFGSMVRSTVPTARRPDLEQAAAERCARWAGARRNDVMAAMAAYARAMGARYREPREALAAFRLATDLAERAGSRFHRSMTISGVALMLGLLDAPNTSAIHLEATRLIDSYHDVLNLEAQLELLARWWAGRNRLAEAAPLLGHLDRLGLGLIAGRSLTTAARTAVLANSELRRHYERGRMLDCAGAVAEAIGQLERDVAELSPQADPGRPLPPGEPLTTRESEIVELVARGYTNLEIAQHAFISERTVESHIARIRRKLGVTSRTQLALWHLQPRPPR